MSCQDRLNQRYAEYMSDREASLLANAADNGWLGVEALLGLLSSAASTLLSQAIQTVLTETGLGQIISGGVAMFAMAMTLLPQMKLALFALANRVAKQQVQQRISTAEDAIVMVNALIGALSELAYLGTFDGATNIIDRVRAAERKLKSAEKTISAVYERARTTGIFASSLHSSAMDNVSSAIDFLNGGTGRARTQTGGDTIQGTLKSGFNEFTDNDEGDPNIKTNWAYTKKFLDEHYKQYIRRLNDTVKLMGLAALGATYRVTPTPDVINLLKLTVDRPSNPDMSVQSFFSDGTWQFASGGKSWTITDTGEYKLNEITVETREPSLEAQGVAVNLTLNSMKNLDATISGLSTTMNLLLNFIIRERGTVKDVREEMEDKTESVPPKKTEAALAIPGWTIALEAIWQTGQSGGFIGAAAADLAAVQEQAAQFKEIIKYLQSQNDFDNNYHVLKAMFLSSIIDLISTVVSNVKGNVTEGLGKQALINAVVRMSDLRRVIEAGINQDKVTLSYLNKFDENSPLIREAIAFLESMGGSVGKFISSGDLGNAIGTAVNVMSASMSLAGQIVSIGEAAADATCYLSSRNKSQAAASQMADHTPEVENVALAQQDELASNRATAINESFTSDEDPNAGFEFSEDSNEDSVSPWLANTPELA